MTTEQAKYLRQHENYELLGAKTAHGVTFGNTAWLTASGETLPMSQPMPERALPISLPSTGAIIVPGDISLPSIAGPRSSCGS
jgi:hypothetical protein